MLVRHLTSFCCALAAVLGIATAVPAASEPVVLRVFYSSNLYGEISPCG